jgi:hypothetical protein
MKQSASTEKESSSCRVRLMNLTSYYLAGERPGDGGALVASEKGAWGGQSNTPGPTNSEFGKPL